MSANLYRRIGCPDCQSNIRVSLPGVLIGDQFTAKMERQILLDGWLIVDEIPLCPTCADNRIAAKIGGAR